MWLVRRPMCSISIGGRMPDLPTLIIITAAIRLSRENHSVR
jgi:hypothetical protein